MQPPTWFSRGLVVSLVFFLLLPGESRGGDDIVLGMSAAFTGPSRGLSIELYRGSQAYFNSINDAGGIHGRKIVIKADDDEYNPDKAIENTVRFIEQDHPFLLYGYMGSPTVARVLPLLEHYKDRNVYLFFPFSGAEPQRRPPYDRYVFNLRASYRQETARLVQHFLKVGRKKIAVFYQIDAYGRSGWDGVRSTLAANGLSMAAEATYYRGTAFTQTMRPQVDVLRKADPDAVISIGTYAACAAFIRDAHDAGWDVPIANVSGVDSEGLLALLLECGKNGKDYTANLINSQVVPSYDDPRLPAAVEYRRLMDRYKPLPPPELLKEEYPAPRYSFISFEGFLNARLLAAILEKMGPDLQVERLKETVESLKEVNLGMGVPVSFGPDRHQGLSADQVYFTVVKEGCFVPLESWERWNK